VRKEAYCIDIERERKSSCLPWDAPVMRTTLASLATICRRERGRNAGPGVTKALLAAMKRERRMKIFIVLESKSKLLVCIL
jgi:hypothetical protein